MRWYHSLLLLGAAFASSNATALPWAEVGSAQLRSDVELLAAHALLRDPVNAWPLALEKICTTVQGGTGRLPSHVESARQRIAARCAMLSDDQRATAHVAVTSHPALIRTFDGAGREAMDATLRLDRRFGALHLAAALGYRAGQHSGDLHLEPTALALDLGDWALYGGYVEQWWGPARDSALLISNNARPFPKLGVTRLTPEPIDFPVIRWLGPVRLDAFAGVLTEKRSDYDNPALIGLRLGFAPAPGLEIGLARTLQLCGRGRPCSLKMLADALFPFGNRDNSGTLDEPGNQLAGFDISYARRLGPVAVRIYGEAQGEDEYDGLPGQFGTTVGANLAGPLGRSGAGWELRAEYTDTLANKLFGSKPRPGSFYNHFIYTAGYTYRGQALGGSIDGDGRMLTLAGSLTDANDRRFYGSWRHVELNRTARNPRLSPPAEFTLATAGVELPSPTGDLRLEFRLSNPDHADPDRLPRSFEAELGWRRSF